MKEKILGESKRCLRLAGIAERREQMICFGIAEGGTPCFVYRRKAEDLDPRAPPLFYYYCNWYFCLV
jgi:hypothetical protein